MAKAGSIYLSLILTGVFAHLFFRANIIEPGDAATTARNILNKDLIFRLGFVADLIYITSFIFLGLVFYRMFYHTEKNHALALLTVVLVSNAVMGLNMLTQFAAQYVMNGANFLNVFQPEQLQALSLLFLDLHKHGVHIGYLFFGLWLLPLGLLVIKSSDFGTVMANITGSLLIAGFVGYQIDFLSYFLVPSHYSIISSFATIPADIGEIILCFWLIAKGTKRNLKLKVVYSANSQDERPQRKKCNENTNSI